MGSSKQDSQIVTYKKKELPLLQASLRVCVFLPYSVFHTIINRVLFSHWKYISITVLLLFLQFLLPYDQLCLEINTSNIN